VVEACGGLRASANEDDGEEGISAPRDLQVGAANAGGGGFVGWGGRAAVASRRRGKYQGWRWPRSGEGRAGEARVLASVWERGRSLGAVQPRVGAGRRAPATGDCSWLVGRGGERQRLRRAWLADATNGEDESG
jgi:hypothetical protein